MATAAVSAAKKGPTMSGWDQRYDNDEPDPDPDYEFRWLTAITVISVVIIIMWFMWPLTK
jgi:hypothetical protein